MHAQVQIFLSEKGGGGGVQAQRRENSLDYFMFDWGFLVQNYPGMRGGGSNYLRGVQMLISVEFDISCDLPGMGVRTPYPPPPPSESAHA